MYSSQIILIFDKTLLFIDSEKKVKDIKKEIKIVKIIKRTDWKQFVVWNELGKPDGRIIRAEKGGELFY